MADIRETLSGELEMKYDDAGCHSEGQFPKDSPAEYGGTHIALLLKWCVLKGWAGQLHKDGNPAALEQLMKGEMSAAEFLFEFCDGKFTDEDLDARGNAFVTSTTAMMAIILRIMLKILGS